VIDVYFCESCPFWCQSNETSSHEDNGLCRISPPMIVPAASKLSLAMDVQAGVWPITYRLDWCGKHPRNIRMLASLKGEGTAS
jgi:hypothetical protein